MNQQRAIEETLPEFVEGMKEVLEKSREKYGDFTQYDGVENFLSHLEEEYKELEEHSHRYIDEGTSPESIMKEAIDLANMAYMIWWMAKQDRRG